MNICTEIIEPYILRVSYFTTCFLLKKKDVCFHSICIKYPSRKPENRMEIAIMKYFFSNNLSCTSFEEYIVWKDNRCPSIHFEECMDMLNKIQLFITCCSPEIWSFYSIIFFSFFSIFCCELMSTFGTKWGIC